MILAFWVSAFGYYFELLDLEFMLSILGVILLTTGSKQYNIMGAFILINSLISYLGLLYSDIFIILTAFFSTVSALNYFAPEIKTSTLNPYTVHLGFYCGNNRSFKMRIGEILGIMPVSSTCIIAKDIAIMIKDGKVETLHSKTVEKSSNYLVVDTGIVATDHIIEMMLQKNGIIIQKSIVSCDCIAIIEDILKEIKLEPKNRLEFIPSIYLRKVLKHGKKSI